MVDTNLPIEDILELFPSPLAAKNGHLYALRITKFPKTWAVSYDCVTNTDLPEGAEIPDEVLKMFDEEVLLASVYDMLEWLDSEGLLPSKEDRERGFSA